MSRILFYDIESAGVNALKADLGFVIVFGYKWSDESKAHSLTLTEGELKRFNDKRLLTEASKLLQEADLVVTHYGSVFDKRFINGRLLINGLPALPPTKMRDTVFLARIAANFSSNRLKYLAKILNLKNQKLENNWPIAWFKVMQGDMATLGELAHYCEGDVLALEELYLKLRPFDAKHPRMVEDKKVCGLCGGKVRLKGWHYTPARKYQRYVCTVCGRWGKSTKGEAI